MFTLNRTHLLPRTCSLSLKVKQMFLHTKTQKRRKSKNSLHRYRYLKVLLCSGAIVLVVLALLFSGDIRLAVLNALISYVLCKFLDHMQHLYEKEAGNH
jgi:hypothetical protein